MAECGNYTLQFPEHEKGDACNPGTACLKARTRFDKTSHRPNLAWLRTLKLASPRKISTKEWDSLENSFCQSAGYLA
ncbi:hypothetical protein CEXT_28061 [Caerostris extrusa]|uniref:Uncharacterized protein n=1 Tax=Caerostris extrusa TaxID=172846 RepID=A0AAV4NE99_CAEEX|nr:hypothetical protein CEXT_28061 [Caerostris extrusa]